MVENVTERLQLYSGTLKPSEVGDLWALCQMEAMLGRTDWACSLFTAEDVELLEWLDDVEVMVRRSCEYHDDDYYLNDDDAHMI